MKVIQFKCNNCGGDIEYEPSKPVAFCPYCGSKLYFHDESENVRLAQVGAGLLRDAGKEIKDFQKRKEEKEEKRREEAKRNEWKYWLALIGMTLFWLFFAVVMHYLG